MLRLSTSALRQQTRLLTILLTALAALPLTACSSTGSGAGSGAQSNGTAGSVSYSNPRRGQSLALVSESMLTEMGIPGDTARERTLNFYSERKNSANVKVCTDDVLQGVVELFESEGFARYAQEGVGNSDGHSLDGVLQVRVNGNERFMLNSDDTQTDPAAKITFSRLIGLFAQIYGEVRQYQAVEGQVEFKQPEISERARRDIQNNGSGLFQGSIR